MWHHILGKNSLISAPNIILKFSLKILVEGQYYSFCGLFIKFLSILPSLCVFLDYDTEQVKSLLHAPVSHFRHGSFFRLLRNGLTAAGWDIMIKQKQYLTCTPLQKSIILTSEWASSRKLGLGRLSQQMKDQLSRVISKMYEKTSPCLSLPFLM